MIRPLRVLEVAALCAFSLAAAHAQSDLRINEVFASNRSIENPDGTISDWVELYNSGASSINLSGFSLSDAIGTPRKWTFPANASIPAGGRLGVLLDSSRPASTSADGTLNAGFSLKENGDDLYLYGSQSIPNLIDSVVFGVQARDYSISRIPDGGTNWKLSTPTFQKSNTEAALDPAGSIRINEFMASPTTGDDWFELFNTGSKPVELSGMFLTDSSTLPTQHKMPPLSFIGSEANGFLQLWASGSTNNADEVNFKLSAGGESIVLYTANGTKIDQVDFTQQTSGVSEGRLPDGGARRVKFPGSPTPGESNFLPFPGLVINEVLAHTDPPFQDAVEIYNTTLSDIDISGWWLSNKKTELMRYQLPAGSVVPAKGYFTIYESSFGNAATAASPFTFSAAYADQVYLAQSTGGQLTGYRIGEEFEASANGVSFGRVETSVPGDSKFVALTRPTFGVDDPATPQEFATGRGAPNAPVLIGPVVISEIMYHPPDTTEGDNILGEYLEIRNITPNTVPLYDPEHATNTWKLKDAVSYKFPSGSSLAPFAYALVVSFDPAIAATREAFRAQYNVPAAVQIFGPYAGTLGNSGDAVELYRPDTPQGPLRTDAGYVPYIRVDKVNYLDVAPWPSSPDGTGHSLQKKNLSSFGNDPVNWEGTAPTAGRGNSPDIADTDGDGMPDVWEDANGLNKLVASDATGDLDADSFTNVQEYIAGTNPRDAASRLAIQSITQNFATGGTQVTIRFPGVAGKNYTVQYRNSMLPDSRWQKLETVSTGASDRVISVVDDLASSRTDRYYRVVTPAAD